MAIKKSCYDTAACKGFMAGASMEKTLAGIKKSIINNELSWTDDRQFVRQIDNNIQASSIPAFAHPIEMDWNGKMDTNDAHSWDAFYSVVDVRALVGVKYGSDGKLVIRNQTEYNMAILRGSLNVVWRNEDVMHLRDISRLPLMAWVTWLSESITRRFGLEPGEQMRLAILCGIYYNSLFLNSEKDLSERDKQRLAAWISQSCRQDVEQVYAMLDKCCYLEDLADFCQKAPDLVESVRLKDLSIGVLITLIGGTWFGVNSREVLAVALEHPPTWLAILYAAATDHSYKNSIIGKLLHDRPSLRNATDDYTRGVARLVKLA